MAYNSAYTGSQVDAAVGAVRQKETKWDNKQDELTGTEDQLVGFNSAGEAVAVAKPDPLPAGGETGQVLTKTAEGTAWDDIPSDLPAGGTDGQILTKTADGVAWEDAPAVGVTSFKGRTGAVTPQEGDYTADMVGARPDTWTPSASDVGAVPTSRTVNGHALSNNVTLDAADVGAVPTQAGTQGQVLGFTADNTVGAMDAPSGLPSGGTTGQMLYQGADGPEWGDKPVMYVNITESGETYSADKTAAEIYEAYQSGYAIFAKTGNDQNGSQIYIYSVIHSGELYAATFLTTWMNMSTVINIVNPGDGSGDSVSYNISNLEADNISFTPTSTLTSDNVQDAIEEVQGNIPTDYVPNTRTVNGKALSQNITLDADDVGAIPPPTRLTVTLNASSWSGNSQTITVNGVITDTSAQDIDISCADKASADAWAAGGVWCSNPTRANRLTFTCTTPPTASISLNIRLWEVG